MVVGGGAVGRRKIAALLAAGARVRLVDPDPATTVAGVERVVRCYRRGDLAGATLAFAATGDRAVNAAVTAEAREHSIPVNVADAPEQGDFSLPAVVRCGELVVSVATGGASPALAAALREQLAAEFGPEWRTVVAIAAALRQKRLTLPASNAYDQRVLRRLLEAGLPDLIAAGDAAAVDRLLAQSVGAEVSLAVLGVPLLKEVP